MKRKKELNPRQWNLYCALKELGDQWITQKQLAELIGYYSFDRNENFHDTQARKLMTKDIRAINESNVIQKIIITGSKGVKLATREEFAKYVNCEFKSVLAKLQRVRNKYKKAGLDGQMRIVFNAERDTIEAFFNDKNVTE